MSELVRAGVDETQRWRGTDHCLEGFVVNDKARVDRVEMGSMLGISRCCFPVELFHSIIDCHRHVGRYAGR